MNLIIIISQVSCVYRISRADVQIRCSRPSLSFASHGLFGSVTTCFVIYLCGLLLISPLALAQQERDTLISSPPPSVPSAVPAQTPHVWLTVEVLEKKPSLGNTASAFNEYIPVVIVDSATSAYLYALSGEMVQLAPLRTYFVSVVSGEDKMFQIDGAPIHVVRTGEPKKNDLIYQREFLIHASVPVDTTALVPERLTADTPARTKPVLKPAAATLSYQATSQCPYLVQFCALSLAKDAERISSVLRKASITDIRVEMFVDIARNITYHRVRAGCFATVMAAKTALEQYAKTVQSLKIGVLPIVVKLE
jgi:hypothetical protein